MLIRLGQDLGQSIVHLDVEKGWKVQEDFLKSRYSSGVKAFNVLNRFEFELEGENCIEVWRSLNINYSINYSSDRMMQH